MIRVREPEIMDDAGLSSAEHLEALAGLANINHWTGSSQIFCSELKKWCGQKDISSLSVLDIATGGGDVALKLGQQAKQEGISLELTVSDISSRALDYARQQAEAAGVSMRYLTMDVLQDKLDRQYDLIMCSLFLHHLDPEQVILLLNKLSQSCRLLLISDLHRSRLNMALIYLGTRILSQSDIVHQDSMTSIRAAYNPLEIEKLALEAGLVDVEIQQAWPCRFLLRWESC